MRYKITFLVLLFSGVVLGQNESAVDESNIILNFGPTNGNEYFNLFNSINTNFDGLNFGTFECDDTFILNGAQQLTHKCGDHDITYSELNYSVEPIGNTHTNFNRIEIFYESDLGTRGFCSSSSNDQNWETNGVGINILPGLAPGTYELQVYTRTERRDSSVLLPDLFISNFGNNFTATFTVIDTTPPFLVGVPADITVECDAIPVLPAVTATDNCDTTLSVNYTETSNTVIDGVGTIVRQWSVTDNGGNTTTETQTISVVDTTPPSLVGVPSDITVECDAIPALPTVTATDNCDTTLSVNFTEVSNTVIDGVGTIVREWSVTDEGGNTTTETQTISVVDTSPPSLAGVPSDITVECDAIPALPTVTATDNCDTTLSVNYTEVSNTVIDGVGTIVRQWSVTDEGGNTTTETQTISVVDTTAPTFIESLPQANITVECDAIPAAVVLTAADNCGSAIVTLEELRTDGASPFEYALTRTWTAEDNSGNQNSYSQIVNVIDTTPPVTPVLAPIEADCSLTVTPPTTTDSCEGTITGTTSASNLTFDSPGTYEIFWVFTDSAGNQSDPVLQEITILDEAPVPPTSIAPLTIIGCEISGYADLVIPSATDFCDGVAIAGTLGDTFIFPFVFNGTQTILWEFTDSNGNTSFQSQEITLDPVPVTGGTLTGTYEGNVFENQVDIGSCDTETIVQMNLSGQSGTITRWERFAINEGIWVDIPNTNATYTATFAAGVLVSTYYRARVQNGTCGEYSSQFFIRALPSGEPPTVEILDAAASYCLGDEIRVKATSQILISDEETNIAYENGDLGGGQLNNNDQASWLVDGNVGGWTSGGNANRPRNWSGINCGNQNNNNQNSGNIVYCGDGSFGIAYGNYTQGNYNGPTTLESPITDLSNAVAASVNFDQAYNFAIGDLALIEVSIDGGLTYQTLIVLHNQGDPATNWFDAGNAENYLNSTSTYYDFAEDNTSISLENYLGEPNVRIRWTFSGTTNNSAWALDNINVNATIYQETDIELTDGIGDPIDSPIFVGQTNQEFTITPNAPGIHEYGITTLINDCRTYDGEGTNFFTIPVSYAYAGENVSFLGGDCGQNTVQLKAYDNTLTAVQNASRGAFVLPVDCIGCDDPGTGVSGQWTITGVDVCGSAEFTSENPLYAGQEASDPNAIFTAEEGSYTLTWTVEGCSSSIQVDIENCNQVDFDGLDDYVDFSANNFSLSDAFSIEAWIKLETLGGSQTIFSKRDANYSGNQFGYDLTINNAGEVVFIFNNEFSNGGKLSSAPHNINTDRWYHIAVTRSGSGAYRLYVDGILLNSNAGNAPRPNTYRALLGAMDNGTSASNNFNGWIDEVKIWNTALTAEQIRFMMNQEIVPSSTIFGNVRGTTIPLDVPNLSWANLAGYYKMESTNIGCGYLNSTLGNNIRGKLKNITSQLTRSAPLPYTSSSDGNWTNVNTWTNPTVWNIPNSNGINGAPIDWNIVRTAHNISSGDKDITVLGLLVDANELSIEDPSTPLDETNNGQMLWVTHYLKLDGIIDLVGESQLIQKRYLPSQISTSILDVTSAGFLERDQQGTTNLFNYNYWGSPVSTINTSQNNVPYSIGSVLHDGSNTANPLDISWTTNNNAPGTTNPITLSSRWLYAYENYPVNSYADWRSLGPAGTLATGLGYTMKGSGIGDPINNVQNYVFIGKPNNNDISIPITNGYQALVGNPYPSAIDAHEFIRDNLPGGNTGSTQSISGTLYFWEHFQSNNSHILSLYEGGYGVLNLTGGLPTLIPDFISGAGIAVKTPGRYIPVGQGFFVESSGLGTQVTFKNNQRIYKKEDGATSVFYRGISNETQASIEDDIQRIRFLFKSNVDGVNRPLMLGFTPNNEATDGYDYGYDAPPNDNLSSDLAFLIDNDRYIIQGVGQFDISKMYALGLSLDESSLIEIHITEFENFDVIPDVYIYDALLGTSTRINETNFEMQMDAGIYNNRFFIAFQDSAALSIGDQIDERLVINYLSSTSEIFINAGHADIKNVKLYTLLGQSLRSWDHMDTFNNGQNTYRIPIAHIAEGPYILHLETSTGTQSKKVIISY